MLQANPALTFRYLCERLLLRLSLEDEGPSVIGMLLNVCLLVLRLLFFEKFAGAPHGQKHKYVMGAPHRES